MKKLIDKFGKTKVYTVIAVIIALIILLCLFLYTSSKPTFKVSAKENIIAEYGEELDNSTLFDDKKTDPGVSVKEVMDFDANKVGDQQITVFFVSKDGKTKSMKIKLTVKDTVKPEFVDFKSEIVIEQNAENVKLEDYFVAKDKASVTISVGGKVDLTKTGKYEIKVTATDSNNNKTDAKSCVVVVASAKDIADGKKLTSTVKGNVPLSKETKEKVDKGEVKVIVEKQSEEAQKVEKEQTKKKDESKTEKETTTNTDKNTGNKKDPSSSDSKKEPEASGSSTSNKDDKKEETTKPNNTPSTPDKDEPAKHEHKWEAVYKTVHHDEVGHNKKVLVKDAWDEKVPKYEKKSFWVCYDDGELMETEEELTIHGKKHAFGELPGDGNYYVDYRDVQVGTETKHHEAEYENKWIVDKKAYDEQVIDYYKCSCGARK